MRMSSKALIINLKLDKSLSGWQTDPLQGGKQYRPRGHQHLRGSKQTKSRFQPYFKPVPSVAAGSAAQLSAPLVAFGNILKLIKTGYHIPIAVTHRGFI